MVIDEELEKIARASRAVRSVKSRMCEKDLITIGGDSDTKPYQLALRIARADKWNTNEIERTGEPTTILINCDLGESENLHLEVKKTWESGPDDKIVSNASLSILRPQQKSIPSLQPRCFDIGDSYACARAKRDLMDNLFQIALGAVSE